MRFYRPWHTDTHLALDRARLSAHDRAAFLRTLTELRTLPEVGA